MNSFTESDKTVVKMGLKEFERVVELLEPHLPPGSAVKAMKTRIKIDVPGRAYLSTMAPTRMTSPIMLRDRILWALQIPLPYPAFQQPDPPPPPEDIP